MNWEGIAAVSEFVGAVVVVITLIYLARQIHQVNAQGQASARYSFIDAYGQMNMAISGSKEVASLFRRGMKGLQLDEDEHYQFFALLGQFINICAGSGDFLLEVFCPFNNDAGIQSRF